MSAPVSPPCPLSEVTTDSREVYKGRLLHAFSDTVRLPDGRQAQREYIVHPGAVMVIPLLEVPGCDEPRVVLERQFRYPMKQVMIEFPAGKLEPGENRLACARRELQEETGYRAREWALAGVIHPVISYSTEFIEIWFARSLVAGSNRLDDGEFLEAFTASVGELGQWCREGQVTDAKTVAGMLWLQNVLSGAWELNWHTPED
ncbi:MAG: NUDIX hydrolase [Burkholderiaceae bacterium]|nr:NUDIX hydrolase [Burkholderiaceae bacterium]